MYVDFKRVQITDVGLPKKIQAMIVQAKEQDERNKLAAKRVLEKKNNADAQIARAKGEYEAATYDAKTKAIMSRPEMLALKRLEIDYELAKRWNGSFGHDNVFAGDKGGIPIIKMN